MSTNLTTIRDRRAALVAAQEAAALARAGKVAGRRSFKSPSGRRWSTVSSGRYVVIDDSPLLRRPRVLKSTPSLSTAILAAERTGSAKVYIVDTLGPVRYRSGLRSSTVAWVTL